MGNGGNPNHDPKNGEFTTGAGGGSGKGDKRARNQKAMNIHHDRAVARDRAATAGRPPLQRGADGVLRPAAHNVIGTRHVVPASPHAALIAQFNAAQVKADKEYAASHGGAFTKSHASQFDKGGEMGRRKR